MYVAVKGGERAIENAHRLLAHGAPRRSRHRRGDTGSDSRTDSALAVDRRDVEGPSHSYDRELASLRSSRRAAT